LVKKLAKFKQMSFAVSEKLQIQNEVFGRIWGSVCGVMDHNEKKSLKKK